MTAQVFVFILFVIAAACQASGQLRQHVLRVADFSGMYVKGPCEVELRNVPDSAGMMVVTASDDAYRALKKVHDDETLYISVEHSDAACVKKGLKSVVAYLPSLPGDFNLVVSGGSTVRGHSLSCSMLYVSVTGRGDVSFSGSVEASNINCSLTGSACISLAGIAAKTLYATLKGSGSINLAGNVVAQAALVVKGKGDIDISKLRSGSLKENVFGDGKILK